MIAADFEDTAARAKQASAALRDARAILRRRWTSSTILMAISEARAAAERMVGDLVRDDAAAAAGGATPWTHVSWPPG